MCLLRTNSKSLVAQDLCKLKKVGKEEAEAEVEETALLVFLSWFKKVCWKLRMWRKTGDVPIYSGKKKKKEKEEEKKKKNKRKKENNNNKKKKHKKKKKIEIFINFKVLF